VPTELFGHLNFGETGFAKKGKKSVGVKRQYSGTLGRVDNCQVGVFANYYSGKGHTFIDRRIFLPEEWIEDHERREEAGVPEGVVFCSKPKLALEMVQTALSEQIPFRWVGGDSVYGDSPTFVQGVRGLGKWYVLDVSSEAHVWLRQPKVGKPGSRGGRAKPKTKPIPVAEFSNTIAPTRQRRFPCNVLQNKGPVVGQSKKTSRQAKDNVDWTNMKHAAGKGGIITRRYRCWLFCSLFCRNCGWGKKEPQMTVPEVRAVLRHLLDLRRWDEDEIVAWCNWRMERNRVAKQCHEARRRKALRRQSRMPK